MNGKSLIDPQTMPAWTAAAFALALIALVVALGGVYRANKMVVATQVEMLALNKKIQAQPKVAADTAPKEVAAAATPAK